MIKNVIFDWSGVLSDDIIISYEAAMVVFEKCGAKRISLDEFRREFELPYMEFYKKYLPKLKKEDQDKMFWESMKSFEKPTPFPQTKEMLGALFKKGINMAVLSSVFQGKLDEQAKEYNIADLFVYLKGSSHDKRDDISEIMNHCKFNEKETAYVGDTSHDIETGKHANLKTIAVIWGYKSREFLEKANPDFIAKSFDELKNIILKVST